jgi:hypothetical protein
MDLSGEGGLDQTSLPRFSDRPRTALMPRGFRAAAACSLVASAKDDAAARFRWHHGFQHFRAGAAVAAGSGGAVQGVTGWAAQAQRSCSRRTSSAFSRSATSSAIFGDRASAISLPSRLDDFLLLGVKGKIIRFQLLFVGHGKPHVIER